MTPYYEDQHCKIFNGDCREILPTLGPVDLVLTDPPYPNKAGHFIEGIPAAVYCMWYYKCLKWFVFWDEMTPPPHPLPLVARHVWHRTKNV